MPDECLLNQILNILFDFPTPSLYTLLSLVALMRRYQILNGPSRFVTFS